MDKKEEILLALRGAKESFYSQVEGFGDGTEDQPQKALDAAHAYAVAFGKCRLFGIDIPDEIIKPHAWEERPCIGSRVTFLAVRRLRQLVVLHTAMVYGIADVFDQQSTGRGAEDLINSIIKFRLDAWAAFVAITDSHEILAIVHRSFPKAEEIIEELTQFLNNLDEVMRAEEQMSFLCIAAGSSYLREWHDMLLPQYCNSWLLDGRFERAAKVLEKSAEASANELRNILRAAPEEPDTEG